MQKINYNLSFTIMILLSLLYGCANSNNSIQSKELSSPFSSKSTMGKREALIVGVSDYAGEGSDLGGIELDVAKMKKLFGSWGFEVKVLYDSDSMDIVNQLDNYGSHLSSNDFFAFYYTGHGSHKKDENGDEEDGEDETLVLSDGDINKHLIDDILYQKFNTIKAKKLIFFDSCHSGTVFRSLTGKTQAKTIKPEDVTRSFSLTSSKGMKISNSNNDKLSSSNGDFIVFSSSQDTEESLATPTGSLFTNSLSEVFSDATLANKALSSLDSILVTKVVNYAKETGGKEHHPKISFSNPSIGTKSLQDFVNPKSSEPIHTTPPIASSNTMKTESLQSTLDDLIINNKIKTLSLKYDKSTYKTGELVKFKIDTLGERGFLSVFYVDSDDVTVLYPNPYVTVKKLEGTYNFPNDLSNGKFDIEAYKSCSGCQEEKTAIYVLLSSEPIGDFKNINSSGLLSFKKESKQSKSLSRAVKIKIGSKKEKESFEPMLSKYQFSVN